MRWHKLHMQARAVALLVRPGVLTVSLGVNFSVVQFVTWNGVALEETAFAVLVSCLVTCIFRSSWGSA